MFNLQFLGIKIDVCTRMRNECLVKREQTKRTTCLSPIIHCRYLDTIKTNVISHKSTFPLHQTDSNQRTETHHIEITTSAHWQMAPPPRTSHLTEHTHAADVHAHARFPPFLFFDGL